ncbi:MAG: tripartite tricarboxylate transporter substrate-binding protein [Hyphomicrobiales bacterium]|jgi:tripartite-type tricarboxylate transporter receptor subunit TctC|nr:tripartite tricarboxylate transporter substrate-binding protein [Hyphomicrobiales bacterium]
MTTLTRRAALGAAAVAASLAMSNGAQAQGYPNKPITMMVAFAAGGPTDVIARIVSEHMSKTLGQQIIIENVAGAGGTTTTARVAAAAPDGYTLIMGQMGTHAAAPALYPNLRYNPVTDFTPIGVAGITPIVIVTKKDFPANNLREFVAYVKANPDKVNQAHAGIGSTAFTTCVLLKAQMGVQKLNAVAYRGTGPALNDLVGGQVDFMCDQVTNLTPQITAGNVKAMGIATPARLAVLPNVPTTTEGGMPDYQISGWNAIFGPKGLPADIQARLVDALDKALEDPATNKRLADLGTVIPNKTERAPAGLAAILARDLALLDKPLRETGAVGQ